MTDIRLLVVIELDVGEFVRDVAEDLGYEVTVTTWRKDFNECINCGRPSHLSHELATSPDREIQPRGVAFPWGVIARP